MASRLVSTYFGVPSIISILITCTLAFGLGTSEYFTEQGVFHHTFPRLLISFSLFTKTNVESNHDHESGAWFSVNRSCDPSMQNHSVSPIRFRERASGLLIPGLNISICLADSHLYSTLHIFMLKFIGLSTFCHRV